MSQIKDKRIKFDFEIYFTNGGNIKGEDFRLDITGDDISDQELADYIVDDMRLLMVGQTRILNKEIFTETHKRKPVNEKKGHDLFVDLSRTVRPGTGKGLPATIARDDMSRENSKEFDMEGTELKIGEIELTTNTGTYMDCPFHRFEHGKDLSEVGLSCFTDLDAIVVSVPFSQTSEITEKYLANYEIRNRAVLIHTGWDKKYGAEKYYDNHPYLTEGAARYLRDCHVQLVGIDSCNIDNTLSEKERPVHAVLLEADILIVQHLCNLDLLPREGFVFSAIPPKLKRVGTFPVRAMAKLGIK